MIDLVIADALTEVAICCFHFVVKSTNMADLELVRQLFQFVV